MDGFFVRQVEEAYVQVQAVEGHREALLRWLDPAKKPRIAMGPESVILKPAASTSSTWVRCAKSSA